MQKTLIVIGLFLIAMGLRSSRKNILRKLGAFAFLVATFWLFYSISDSILIGLIGASLWFFLPWIELLTHIRKLRMPVDNRLRHRELPNPSFFPNAIEAAAGMEEAGFDHVSDCGWQWSGMQQHFRLFWNPEEKAVASVCLCEQNEVAFAFISITSTDLNGKTWRTTNFPFAPTLRCAPELTWNHVPCEKSCFHQILKDHRDFLKKKKIVIENLLVPDPEILEDNIENEMREQVQHNLRTGIIEMSGETHFQYSKRGLVFLWCQFVKDMIRLC